VGAQGFLRNGGTGVDKSIQKLAKNGAFLPDFGPFWASEGAVFVYLWAEQGVREQGTGTRDQGTGTREQRAESREQGSGIS